MDSRGKRVCARWSKRISNLKLEISEKAKARRIPFPHSQPLEMSIAGFSVLRGALEDSGGAHATADAHGDQAVAGVAALEFADDGRSKFCAGAAERMAESDGAAVDVDARGIETSGFDDAQSLRGEGFVELDDVNLIER